MARLLVSAAHKSSGKTTFTVGLAAALTRRDRRVQCFKKGPDYIDPLWHRRASGRPSYNLDFNTQTAAEIATLVAGREAGMDLALIEGNKGLHDGVDLEGSDSTAALAKLLRAPVVLVLDASGMTRGIAPLLTGYRLFDPEVDIAGVVLNRVATARQEGKLVEAIERYTDVPVLGAIGRRDVALVEERHLGLTTPQETADVERIVARLAETVADGVDLARLEAIAATRGPAPERVRPIVVAGGRRAAPADAPTIAIARDGAFCFHYQDDLEALERAGARLVFFSALEAERLPACDGLFVGGGFPESHVAALEANASLRADIAAKGRAGLPIYAECGGLMYLSRAIVWGEMRGEMVGLVPGEAVVHDRPQGRGLVLLEETAAMPWPRSAPAGEGGGARVRAHEFHYARLENLDPGLAYAWKVRRGDGITGTDDGVVIANTLASFSHLRATSRFDWTRRFVDFVRQCRDQARAERRGRPAASLAPRPCDATASVSRPRDPAVLAEAMAFGGMA
jgi:cobyrinic acid a,c-diamide synthase